MSFRKKISSGEFVVTGEVTPKKSVDTASVLADAEHLRSVVDAVNVTDNQRACVRTSSIAVSKVLLDNGFEPVIQLTCRDRNSIGLQSDLLGAHMLGLRNVLALSGDHPRHGDHPNAKPVFELDATRLVEVVSGLNKGFDLEGDKLAGPTDFFVGAAANPGASDIDLEVLRVKKKLKAGAQFFQTQVVYDADVFKSFLKELPGEAKILAGVVPLKSARMAEFMNEKVPGVNVPKELIKQVGGAKDPLEAGIEIAAELVSELKGVCAGVHIMALGIEDKVPEIVRRAGLS